MSSMRATLVIAVTAWIGLSPTAAAQPAQTRVSYDVELSTVGSLLDRNCSATGTDILAGTLVGMEPALPADDNEYVGTLTRSTCRPNSATRSRSGSGCPSTRRRPCWGEPGMSPKPAAF